MRVARDGGVPARLLLRAGKPESRVDMVLPLSPVGTID